MLHIIPFSRMSYLGKAKPEMYCPGEWKKNKPRKCEILETTLKTSHGAFSFGILL